MLRMRWLWASGKSCAGLAARTFQYFMLLGEHILISLRCLLPFPFRLVSACRNIAALHALQGQLNQAAQRKTDILFP